MTDISNQIQKSIDHLKSEFSGLQLGRANVSLVDEIEVDSYGSKMAMKAVANISCPDAKTLKIEPWDKSVLAEIEKAILEANIGINPQNMGESILLPIPPMTEERRKQMVKRVHEMGERARISIRNARQEEMKIAKMEKEEGLLSEDQLKDRESDIQEATDKGNKEVDDLVKNKEQEILSV